MARKSVLVVQRRMTNYRVPFFEELRSQMAGRNMELVLAHGSSTAAEATKRDEGELDWALRLNTSYMLGDAICWQPFGASLREIDLVVIAHENKLLYNLVAQYLTLKTRVVLWGHGANLQGNQFSLRERIKRRTARQADWWFGYTSASLPHIIRTGFPVERTTILNNAVDTVAMAKTLASVTPRSLAELRRELGVTGDCIGLFLGSLYDDKRICFLLEAAREIRRRVPEFELVIAGAGPDCPMVEEFCASNEWARYAGSSTGQRKADLLRLARVMLNPGLVGLGVLDSFVSGVPMVTTNCGLHSPEVAYLDHGVNGLIANNDLPSYVEAVVGVLADQEFRSSLSAGCAVSAGLFTIERMTGNFCDGLEQCFAAPSYRSWHRAA